MLFPIYFGRILNPLTANDELSCPRNMTLDLGPQGGYLGALQPMLPCVTTLCPLISLIKSAKLLALKGLAAII